MSSQLLQQYLKQKQYEKAYEEFKKLPDEYQTQDLRESVTLPLPQFQDEKRVCDAQIARFPKKPEPYLKAGNVLQKWLLHEKAIQLYELAFKPTPKLFEVKIKMALSYLYLKEYQKAKDCLDEAQKNNIPLNSEFFELLPSNSQINIAMGELYYLSAIEFFEKKEFDKSLSNLEISLNFNSKNIDALFYKGKNLFQIEQFQKAIDQFNEVIKINRNYYKASQIWKANSLVKLEKYGEATIIYDQFQEEKMNIYRVIVLFKEKEDNIELAQKQFFQLEIEIQHQFEGYFLIGELQMKCKQYVSAIDSFSKALQQKSNNENTLVQLGFLNQKLNDYPTALKFFQNALRINSKCHKAKIGIGNCLLGKRQYKLAIEKFDEVLQEDQNNGQAKKKKEKAIKESQAMTEMNEIDSCDNFEEFELLCSEEGFSKLMKLQQNVIKDKDFRLLSQMKQESIFIEKYHKKLLNLPEEFVLQNLNENIVMISQSLKEMNANQNESSQKRQQIDELKNLMTNCLQKFKIDTQNYWIGKNQKKEYGKYAQIVYYGLFYFFSQSKEIDNDIIEEEKQITIEWKQDYETLIPVYQKWEQDYLLILSEIQVGYSKENNIEKIKLYLIQNFSLLQITNMRINCMENAIKLADYQKKKVFYQKSTEERNIKIYTNVEILIKQFCQNPSLKILEGKPILQAFYDLYMLIVYILITEEPEELGSIIDNLELESKVFKIIRETSSQEINSNKYKYYDPIVVESEEIPPVRVESQNIPLTVVESRDTPLTEQPNPGQFNRSKTSCSCMLI